MNLKMEMNGNYLSISGKYYGLDLNKVMEFVGNSTTTVQNIHQVYQYSDEEDVMNGEMRLSSKEISESKENVNEVIMSNRYNLITTVLNLILIPISDSSTGEIIVTDKLTSMNIGQKLAFNTLIDMGILYEIEFEE